MTPEEKDQFGKELGDRILRKYTPGLLRGAGQEMSRAIEEAGRMGLAAGAADMTPHQPPPLTEAELEFVESRQIDTAMIDRIAYEYWMISNWLPARE